MSAETMKSAVLNLERIAFEEIKYKRDVNKATRTNDYEMNFTRQIDSREDNDHFRVALTAHVWDKIENSIDFSITIVGFFTCSVEDENTKANLINNNTIAILFPYLRSQISLVTTQPDLPPMILPPMNIVAMFQEAENQ